jgi:MFS family permease
LWFVPQFALTLLGGVLADRIDARKLIGVAQINSAIAMIMVGVTAMLGVVQLWHLALGAFLWGLSAAIDEPARASFFPRLLPRPLLRSAVPLISMAFGSSRVIAPSIAGFLIAAAGAPTTFLLSAAAVSTMIAVLFLLRPARAEARSHGSRPFFTEPALPTRQQGLRQSLRRVVAQRHRGRGLHTCCRCSRGCIGGRFTGPWIPRVPTRHRRVDRPAFPMLVQSRISPKPDGGLMTVYSVARWAGLQRCAGCRAA